MVGRAGRVTTVPDIIILPDIENSADLQIIATSLDRQLRALSEFSSNYLDERLSLDDVDKLKMRSRFPGLFDELGFMVSSKDIISFDERIAKDRREKVTLSELESDSKFFDIIDYDLVAFVEQVNSALNIGPRGIRSSNIKLEEDDAGNTTIFPKPHFCRQLISDGASWCSEYLNRYPALAAIVMMVAIVQAHPFTDGNGRTSRIVANSIIRHRHRADIFIPINTIMSISEGGFIIKMRRAIFGGDWKGIMKLFEEAGRLCQFINCQP